MNLHPYRRSILFRWIASVVLLAGVATLATVVDLKQMLPRPEKPTRQSPLSISLPSQEHRTEIAKAIEAIRSLPSGSQPRLTSIPARTLMPPAETTGKPEMALSLLLLGRNNRAVVINGEFYEEGDSLPGGWSVLTISEEGVLLAGERSTELLAWEPLTQIELKQADTARATTAQTTGKKPQEEPLAVDAAVSPEETKQMLETMLKDSSGTEATEQEGQPVPTLQPNTTPPSGGY